MAGSDEIAPWRLLSSRYGMVQLHPNTHLYYSPGLCLIFPGRADAYLRYSRLHRQCSLNCHVAIPVCRLLPRNFPMAANVLSRKLRAKEGYGAPRLMAATVVPDTPVLIVLEGQ